MPATRSARTVTAVALVAAGALGATALTGVAVAASSATVSGSVTPAAAAAAPAALGAAAQNALPDVGPDMGPGMGAGMPGMRGGWGRLGAGLGQPLHGEGTFKKSDGSIVTMRFQQGVVTSNSSGALAVKSDDGYTATWTVGSGATVRRDRATVTVDKIQPQDHVIVVAEVSGATTTVKRVMAFSPAEWTKMQQRRAAMEKRFQQRSGSTGSTPSKAPGA